MSLPADEEPPRAPVAMPSPPMPSPQQVARLVLVVLAVGVGAYLLWLIRQPLSWIFIATFISIALSRPIDLLARRIRRGFAIAIVYVGLLLIPFGLAAIVVPPIVREGAQLAEDVPGYAQDLQEYVRENERLREIDRDYDITTKVREEAAKLPEKVGDAASTLQDIAGAIVSSIFAGVTILIMSIFISVDRRRFIEWVLRTQPPERRPRLRQTIARVEAAIGNYVGGMLLQGTIAGIATFIVLTLLGVPFAAPLAVLVGLFDLIPLVGATIGAVLVGIVTLFTDFPTALIIWAIWSIIYQQLENTVIQPQIQKRAVNVHAFLVLVSVLIGATLFGIIGALIAVPMAASIQIVGREFIRFHHADAEELPQLPESTGGGNSDADEGGGAGPEPAPG